MSKRLHCFGHNPGVLQVDMMAQVYAVLRHNILIWVVETSVSV
jgi:hypothetical protein